ncbi:atherin-like [Cervus elaphus]|uniref:atherin-like n=1 Tax=Cervus elaphus TaxID=9860 RepID=UPI001CC2F6AA|nr:atherin-like [Cervus elaphus]
MIMVRLLISDGSWLVLLMAEKATLALPERTEMPRAVPVGSDHDGLRLVLPAGRARQPCCPQQQQLHDAQHRGAGTHPAPHPGGCLRQPPPRPSPAPKPPPQIRAQLCRRRSGHFGSSCTPGQACPPSDAPGAPPGPHGYRGCPTALGCIAAAARSPLIPPPPARTGCCCRRRRSELLMQPAMQPEPAESARRAQRRGPRPGPAPTFSLPASLSSPAPSPAEAPPPDQSWRAALPAEPMTALSARGHLTLGAVVIRRGEAGGARQRGWAQAESRRRERGPGARARARARVSVPSAAAARSLVSRLPIRSCSAPSVLPPASLAGPQDFSRDFNIPMFCDSSEAVMEEPPLSLRPPARAYTKEGLVKQSQGSSLQTEMRGAGMKPTLLAP